MILRFVAMLFPQSEEASLSGLSGRFGHRCLRSLARLRLAVSGIAGRRRAREEEAVTWQQEDMDAASYGRAGIVAAPSGNVKPERARSFIDWWETCFARRPAVYEQARPRTTVMDLLCAASLRGTNEIEPITAGGSMCSRLAHGHFRCLKAL